MGTRDCDQPTTVTRSSSDRNVRIVPTLVELCSRATLFHSPHGALHDVVRWIHRSSFTIRPPVAPSQGQTQSRLRALRIPIPNADGFCIDPGWYGTVVLESEGTNEGLADLQMRCGSGVFPPRAETFATKMRNEKERENKRVWRILREKRYVVFMVCALPD